MQRVLQTCLALAAALLACVAAAPAASADPLPAGDYTAQLTSMSVRPGGLIATQTFPFASLPAVPFTVPNPPVPVDASFGEVTVPAIDLNSLDPTYAQQGSVLNFTVVGPVTVHADPTDGSGSAAVSGYGGATVITALGTYTCKLGTPTDPISTHLSTDNAGGARYSASTGVITVADPAVHVPELTCTGGLFPDTVASTLNTFAGLPTDSGQLSFTGLIRPVPAATTPSGSQPTGTPTTPQSQQQSGGQTSAGCVVPKLKGKKLGRAKKALKKAHCRLGTVTKKKRPNKAGRVLSQRPKAGTHRARGSRVNVVVGRR